MILELRARLRAARSAAARTPRPMQDHGVGALRRISFTPSTGSGYRLNLVLPTAAAGRTFGGIRTALDAFEAIGAEVAERRIISLDRAATSAGELIAGYASVEPGEDPPVARQYVAVEPGGAPLAVRAADFFVATFWTTAEVVQRIRAWQASTFGAAPHPFAYLIQDFEPGFYPWSANSMLALATYDDPDGTIAVFNTSLLQSYFHDQGIHFATEFAFEPRLLPELQAAMASPPIARTRTIVVYGRPGTPRNAFPAIVDGLRAWQAQDPGAAEWDVVSVGQAHPAIDLGGGRLLRSIGKLDLVAYARLLRGAAIGVSLMVSPHPSYPPLEMANLGMLVLTNRFAQKNLNEWHTNIHSIDDLRAATMASALSDLCRRFEADPDIGSSGRSSRPEYTSDDPMLPFASQLADELRRGVS